MKVICTCGNEVNLIEPNDGESRTISVEKGMYVTTDNSTFDFWQEHDVVGIVCNKCEKAIWMFT